MTDRQSRDSLPVRKIARKPHTKSRNGCEGCKRRRVKCDEKKPQCSNCIRHVSACSFELNLAFSQTRSFGSSSKDGHSTSPRAASPTSRTSVIHPIDPVLLGKNNPQLLNLMDLELLHNYTTSTSLTISNNSDLQTYMRDSVPQLGISHPFVLHGVLAFSALHLARFKNEEGRVRYTSYALHHYTISQRAASALLQNINAKTGPPLYLSATFGTLFSLGEGPRPGNFLLFTNQGVAGWLTLFRGMRTIMQSTDSMLFESTDLSPLFGISNRLISTEPRDSQHLENLREQLLAAFSNDPDLRIYLAALKCLSMSFPSSSDTKTRAAETSPQFILAWMHRVSDEFVFCLQQRKSAALAIFAYFCVLLNDLSTFWWIRGWAEHLISEIYASVSGEHRVWLRWPMEEIGWIPE
ncbi:Sterol uptake control protein [Lachnellula suecica]|uniref:Sterol uptake control protein n=1 Tax=Lachnellula suecica TaxID=602035 RepID=A0A8T9C4H2_9HELO|nr:Sterol uptake control protein [Lachnellula suecica]